MLIRSFAWAYTGDLSKAEADLITYQEFVPQDAGRAKLTYGFITCCKGLIEQAISYYLEAASSAKNLGEWETEFYAEVALCAVLTEQGSYFAAQAHLARAKGIIPEPREDFATHEAIVAMRRAALLTSQGNSDAIQTLQHVLLIFAHAKLERYCGVAELHLAEALFHANQQNAGLAALSRAVNFRHSVGSQAYFALELRALPHVFEVVCCSRIRGTEVFYEDWRALEAQNLHEVRLNTLGNYGLQVGGQAIKLDGGMVKAVEFLAYLLEEGESKLEDIIGQIFDAGSHVMARNRIHKLRESIARQVPGLCIPYSKERNTYQLEPMGVRLRWDVREVRKALAQGGATGMQRALALYTGEFLPRTDTDWAENKRYDLELELAEIGVETMRDLFGLGRFEECLRLAERLVKVSGLNLGVQLMLLRATARVHGALAARERLLKVDSLLQSDLRAMPELMRELVMPEFLN